MGTVIKRNIYILDSFYLNLNSLGAEYVLFAHQHVNCWIVNLKFKVVFFYWTRNVDVNRFSTSVRNKLIFDTK